ncbi:MAG: geranylgeranylglycerol-phosphate geranylgeranyltransferase [Candidatus Kariarchaeaceae archaeon]|jgi:geranylgeranylglycerol-phosphate geranylgeranyltransferase
MAIQNRENSTTDRLKAFIRLTRPLNSLTAGVAVVAALFLALDGEDEPFDLLSYLLIASAAFLTTAHAMVHNDIVDFDIDTINAPHRPLPANMLSIKEAKIWAVLLLILACTIGFIVDTRLNFTFPISFFWALSNALILDCYNLFLKQMGIWGNLIVGYVVWALFIYADLIVNQKLTMYVEAIGMYAFFWNWGREVLKDILDIQGDKAGGVKTIAVRFGARGGAIVGTGILSIAVLWTIPMIIFPRGSIFVPVALVILNLIIIYRSVNIIKNLDLQYIYQTKKLYLRLMLLAVIGLSIEQVNRVV